MLRTVVEVVVDDDDEDDDVEEPEPDPVPPVVDVVLEPAAVLV